MTDLLSRPAFVAIIVAALVISVIVAYRTELLRRVALWAGQHRLTRSLRRPVADRIVPKWREHVGKTRSQYSLPWRVDELRRMSNPPFAIVGGTFLDFEVGPVTVSRLSDNEFYNLDSVTMTCGGSAIHLGQALYRRHQVRSFLYTRVGGQHFLGGALTRLLKNEKWIRGKLSLDSDGRQCGVSVHLVQPAEGFKTTFTHTGAVHGLQWNTILSAVDNRTKRGGVLYLSGYFRTGLHTDLVSSLKQLSPKVLICLEHGRFRADANPQAVEALQNAFRRDLIDVYLCTRRELRELMKWMGVMVPENMDATEELKLFAQQRRLPALTVVRSGSGDRPVEAHVLTAQQVRRIAGDGVPDSGIGSKAAFNAEFVHALVTGRPEPDWERLVGTAVQSALAVWGGTTQGEYRASRH